MAIRTVDDSMDGGDSGLATMAVFVRASNDTTSLGELAGGASTDFVKIGLLDAGTINGSTTLNQREAINSKNFIKITGGKRDSNMTVDALVPTNAVMSCSKGFIGDYYGATTLDIPDEDTSFTGEAIFLFLDESQKWDNVASLAHNGGEYWKKVEIVPNGSKTLDGTSSLINPFEIHLQRHSSGKSIRNITPNDDSGIDVREEYVDMSTITA